MTDAHRLPGRAHRRPRLRHRTGDARRLRSPLPALSPGQQRRQGPFEKRRLARPAARPGAAHRVLRQARRPGHRAAAERVRRGVAADGGLASGQAALHRPAYRALPTRARRDLLQLGDDQDPAPQPLPQRLHLRPLGDLDRASRERRAAALPTYRYYYPTRDTAVGTWHRVITNFQLDRDFEDLDRDVASVVAAVDRAARRDPPARQLPDPGAVVALLSQQGRLRRRQDHQRLQRDAVRAANRPRPGRRAGGRRGALRRGGPAPRLQLRARLFHGRRWRCPRPTSSSCAR